MAKIESVRLVDDLDGSEAAETVRIGLDGREYDIDLSEQNAEGLRKGLADFIAHARPVRGRQKPRNASPARRRETAEIRDWAIANGYTVADRGRIPGNVLDAYNAR